MKSSIFIPKRINVGFQERRDTYTGKLAYIVYYDEKNVLRKEQSWNSWRNQSIPNEEYDNTPIDGFVLNKKVGDYKSGWNHRQAYCRIYDPRGFEFEITIENLLYILENVTSTKGKGLEGQFIYGWDGTELVLLPVDSPDYTEIVNYTNIVQQGDSLKTKDLVIGASYLGKDNEVYIYMGKHPRYGWGYKYRDNNGEVVEVTNAKNIPEDLYRENKYIDVDNAYYGQYLWFAHRYEDSDYIDDAFVPNGKFKYDFDRFKGIPKKIIKCITTERATDFDTIVEKMEHSSTYSPVDYKNTKAIRYTLEQFKQIVEQEFQNIRREGVFSDTGYLYTIEKNENNTFNIGLSPKRSDTIISYKEPEEFYKFRRYKYNDGTVERTNDFISRFKKYMNNDVSRVIDITVESLTLEQLYNALNPSYIVEFLENGKMHRIINNVLRIKEDEVMHGLQQYNN